MPSLGHRHAAVRASALRALAELLPCGAAGSVEALVGYREPNVVPIAAFYGNASHASHASRVTHHAESRRITSRGTAAPARVTVTRHRVIGAR
jgi:hypothetical protein